MNSPEKEVKTSRYYLFYLLSLQFSVIISILPLKIVIACFQMLCQRVFRNFDPNLRTQEKAVEYVRALNAAKLEKVNGSVAEIIPFLITSFFFVWEMD